MPPQQEKVSATLHWKYFGEYFADAACFAYDSAHIEIVSRDDQDRQKRYVKNAIISSALALESAANCCLDVLQLDKGSFEEFDKLQTLGKFDIFLNHVRSPQHLNREHELVRPIRNLISCRNTYVHSKVLKEGVEENQVNANFWKPLGLPHNSAYWQPLHAAKVFTVLSDFLNYFFFEAVGYPYQGIDGRGIVANILSSGVASLDGQKLPGDVEFAPIRGEEFFQSRKSSKEWDLEFAFLGGYTTGGDNKQIYPKRKWGDYSHCQVEDLIIPWKPVWYNVPGGLGIFLVGNNQKQKHRK